jgi:hypothetical protein
MMAATAADGIRQARSFDEPVQWRFDWDLPCTRDDWLEQVPTAGGNNRLPPEQLAALLAGMGAAIDAAGGGFRVQYAALVVTAVRTGAA